jgi:hypothetical protein
VSLTTYKSTAIIISLNPTPIRNMKYNITLEDKEKTKNMKRQNMKTLNTYISAKIQKIPSLYESNTALWPSNSTSHGFLKNSKFICRSI